MASKEVVRKSAGWVLKIEGGRFASAEDAGFGEYFGTISKKPVFYKDKEAAEKALSYFIADATNLERTHSKILTDEFAGPNRKWRIKRSLSTLAAAKEMLACKPKVCYVVVTKKTTTTMWYPKK